MSLTVHLALVFHVFIAVAVMVMVCGRHGIGPLETTREEANGSTLTRIRVENRVGMI